MLVSEQMAQSRHEGQIHLSTGVNKPVNKIDLPGTEVPISSDQEIWNQAISHIQEKLTAQNFDLWFRPIVCLGAHEDRITLAVPNRFIKDWFENHYIGVVSEEIFKQTQKRFEFVWLIDENTSWPSQETLAESENQQTSHSPKQESSLQVVQEKPGLLSRYQFDTFIVGPSNQLAEAASRAVAQTPGGKYNPLFLYGGVGLGKTHLLHAIGHQILQSHPHWKIVYIKTETFMNEYINLVRNNRIEEFRVKYRQTPDVLLMDDIQYLGGKERTQDEFFHTFNALFEMGKQIVVTADKYPHQIPDLEERIRSRFQWGLIADIQPPELETRMAILVKKAEYDGIDLPQEVAYFLASNIRSNIRELEGLLIRVAAFASLQNKKISIDFVQETLKNFLSQSFGKTSVELIQRKVSSFFKISEDDLRSSKRQQSIARPRQIAMYLTRKLCKISYPEVAQSFGGKDHTTVLAACRKVESLLKADPTLRQTLLDLERQLQ